MENASGRLVWVDIAKGIGIALVVAGHTDIAPLATRCLSIFHMPLFFFLSGLLYQRRPFARMVSRRARTLLVPYLIFSLIGFLLYNGVIDRSSPDPGRYGRQLLGILYGTPDGSYGLLVFPLWFLPSLFLAHILFSLALLVSRGRRLRVVLIVSTLAAAGFLNSMTVRLDAPWSAVAASVGVMFLAFGYACRNAVSRLETVRVGRTLIVITLSAIAVFVTASMNEPVIMARGSYGVIPLFLPGAISGIAMIVLLSILVARYAQKMLARTAARVIAYLGRNTLTILAMHVPAAALAAHLLSQSHASTDSSAGSVAVKGLAVLLLLASIELFKRCPWVVPKSPSARPSALPQFQRP